ncbi:MAG: hypothetical protein DWH97_10770 [Planctomycetota bacterium]|nr:MAG: hypothetical protein DWH97_10770 [Planctomycetota bacterium]
MIRSARAPTEVEETITGREPPGSRPDFCIASRDLESQRNNEGGLWFGSGSAFENVDREDVDGLGE